MTRSTDEEITLRQEKAAELLSSGWPPAMVVKELSSTYKVSPQQARDYVRKGKELVQEAFDLSDVKWHFTSIMNDLQIDHMKAIEANNINAAIGASKARVNHFKQISNIDPMGCWNSEVEAEFSSFVSERLAPRKGKIPKRKLHADLDILDKDHPSTYVHPWYEQSTEDNIPF
tara:strand:- start:209 stop:727 length:519 start_codon:yes stop_codon:yes gene_type:complete